MPKHQSNHISIASKGNSTLNTVNGKEVIATHTILVFDHEEAFIHVNARGFPIRMKLIFDPTAEGAEQAIAFEVRGDHIEARFTKWQNTLGTALNEEAEIATVSNKKVTFLLMHHRVGRMNMVTIQFLMER